MLDVFPQQIYFANGFWLWLALAQEHSLCCGCQSATIAAEAEGGKGLLLGLRQPPWKKVGLPHYRAPALLPSIPQQGLSCLHQHPGKCPDRLVGVPFCQGLPGQPPSLPLSVHIADRQLPTPGNRPGCGFRQWPANPASPEDLCSGCDAEVRPNQPPNPQELTQPGIPQGDAPLAQPEWLGWHPLSKRGRVARVHPNEALHPALPLGRAGHYGVCAGADGRVRTRAGVAWVQGSSWGLSHRAQGLPFSSTGT